MLSLNKDNKGFVYPDSIQVSFFYFIVCISELRFIFVDKESINENLKLTNN